MTPSDELSKRGDPQRFRDEDEIDREARNAPKSEWVERSAPAAGDPVSDDERRGLNILAQNDPRGDGSIAGVSDAKREDVPRSDDTIAGGERRNPPVDELPDGSTLL